jgi:hypothetical protein
MDTLTQGFDLLLHALLFCFCFLCLLMQTLAQFFYQFSQLAILG